jgi:predicted heme/steroid binding protein/uncharacterized membrane protein
MKEFDVEELKQYNGENGKPVYIAHGGKVYDVSDSKMWRGGLHMKRHGAGQDLTTDIQAAPHETDILERYPQIGSLKKKPADRKIPPALDWLLVRVPMLRRHPHPMTVHFPIVFVFSTTVFSILYVLTGERSFEITALHCLAAGIIFTIVGISTGFYTWWLNYMAKMLRPVRIKIPLTLTLLIVQIGLFFWRVSAPDVLANLPEPASIIYFVLIISLSVMVTIIGWNGAAMTFPVEKEG